MGYLKKSYNLVKKAYGGIKTEYYKKNDPPDNKYYDNKLGNLFLGDLNKRYKNKLRKVKKIL